MHQLPLIVRMHVDTVAHMYTHAHVHAHAHFSFRYNRRVADKLVLLSGQNQTHRQLGIET